MEKMIKYIKNLLPQTFVIAGNVCTKKGVIDLEKWGADSVKIGIGPGIACFIDNTKVKTINGYKSIQDIEIGEFVLTHNCNYKEVINKIRYLSNENFLSINGEICTEDHEFFIIKKSDIINVTDDNYLEYCFFEKAKYIDEEIHMITSFV
jgi:hypothetical protein